MPVLRVSVHPMGLHPVEAVKAWQKHSSDGMSLDEILKEGEIVNLLGHPPGRYALWSAMRAHYTLSCFVWIFLSRTDGPRPSQKVSKRFCRLCFGSRAASSRSHGTGVLLGNAAAWGRIRMHVYVRVAGGPHGIRLMCVCVRCTHEREHRR